MILISKVLTMLTKVCLGFCSKVNKTLYFFITFKVKKWILNCPYFFLVKSNFLESVTFHQEMFGVTFQNLLHMAFVCISYLATPLTEVNAWKNVNT